MNSTWARVVDMERNDKRHMDAPNEVANDLKDHELATIISLMMFFGASVTDVRQAYFDLSVIRYRVFDWLGMCIMGRVDCRTAVQVLTYSFLKSDGDVDRFIEDLRRTDYDVDESWKELDLDA